MEEAAEELDEANFAQVFGISPTGIDQLRKIEQHIVDLYVESLRKQVMCLQKAIESNEGSALGLTDLNRVRELHETAKATIQQLAEAEKQMREVIGLASKCGYRTE